MGTAKIVLAFFVLVVLVFVIVISLMGGQFDLRVFLATVVGVFYSYYLAYSGRTQKKQSEIERPIVIWLGIVYGIVVLGFFIYEGRWIWSSILWGIPMTIVNIDDFIRMREKR